MIPRRIATVHLWEFAVGYSVHVDIDGETICIGEPAATIGGALDRARQLVLERRKRVRLGPGDVT